jgi:hypothetical protein
MNEPQTDRRIRYRVICLYVLIVGAIVLLPCGIRYVVGTRTDGTTILLPLETRVFLPGMDRTVYVGRMENDYLEVEHFRVETLYLLGLVRVTSRHGIPRETDDWKR